MPHHAHNDPVVRLMRLNATVQGISSGIMAGLIVMVATIWLVIKGGDQVGPHMQLLGQYFIGYRVTYGGSLIGFAYAFVVGFLCGYFVATLYNSLAAWKQRNKK